MFEFNNGFKEIKGEVLTLKILDMSFGNANEIPYYWYEIILNGINKPIGKISIRIGCNYHTYYNGNIGYEINTEYRGNNYSYHAGKMVLEVARFHDMNKIFLTCDYDNIASYKIIEKLGGILKEISVPPQDYFGWYEGMLPQRIYELVL